LLQIAIRSGASDDPTTLVDRHIGGPSKVVEAIRQAGGINEDLDDPMLRTIRQRPNDDPRIRRLPFLRLQRDMFVHEGHQTTGRKVGEAPTQCGLVSIRRRRRPLAWGELCVTRG